MAEATPPPPQPTVLHYDLLVIGGGSGGLQCSKVAAKLGKKVACCDFVKPSPAGTTWGLGGTCVNVGCIPKKLMHQAALHGKAIKDSKSFGWDTADQVKHSWTEMVTNVQMHVKSLNFGYRADLMSNQVKYLNAFATFLDPHTVQAVDKKGKITHVTADQFVVCTGGRPRYPDIPGAKEHCITSDDVFALKSAPGKTLVVGASYVALECAGFIHGVGFETQVMMRSIPLRGFDQQMAGIIKNDMAKEGINFIEGAVPTSVEKLENGMKKVHWQYKDGSVGSDEYDTVMFAVGRDVCTGGMGLDKAGVQVNPKTGKIPTVNEQTNVPHIYAIGDVIDGDALSPPSALTELTPVAIQAGKLLAQRLYGGDSAQMNYQNVPTTVYTPLEYGAIGYSEEDAEKKFGSGRIEVYHTYFTPLELTLPHRGENACYAKLICDKEDSERVLGLHVCGPSAGEMTQGFAVAIKLGATKADFDDTVGIHPTNAEQFTTIHVTKSSGASAETTGC
uniref:thioredoxin-disulfide reductase (NADPH) n=1 Tax=Haptolina brevifila TaxID=156173 RepID=A0A7S2NDE8_9EUKA